MLKNTIVTMPYNEFEELKNQSKSDIMCITMRTAKRLEQEYPKEEVKKILQIIQEEKDKYYKQD